MNKKRYRYDQNKLKRSFLFALCLFLLPACSGKQGSEQTVSEKKSYDWKESGFVAQGAETESLLYAEDYQAITLDEPFEYRSYCAALAEDGFIWLEVNDDDKQTYLSHRSFFADTQECRIKPQDDWGVEEPDIYRVSVTKSDQLVFFVPDGIWKYGEQDWAKHYYVVYTDGAGRLQKKSDILPVLKERGIWEDSGFARGEIECDSEGNLYLWDIEKGEAYLLSAEGEYITSYQFTDDGSKKSTMKCFKTDQGDVLIAKGQGQSWEFAWLDAQSGNARKICTAEIPNVRSWYGMWGNVIYCNIGGKLTGWDISTGEKRCLYDMVANAAERQYTYFQPTEGGGQLLAADNGEKFLLKLTDTEPESAGGLLVANICKGDSYLESSVAGFGRENPLYGIAYEYDSEEESADRILMEVLNGGGPDIMYVSYTDMCNLWEKGALGDLNQLLSEETMDILYPAAREIGSIDGQMAGIPLYTHMGAFWITGEYWQEDSWSTEDVLQILKERNALSGIFLDSHGEDSYDTNLRFFLGEDLLESPYIRDGHADFDTEEFREILFWIKEKTTFRESKGLSGNYDFLQDGQYLGIYRTVMNLNNYHNYLEWVGKGAHVAGLPSEEGRKIPLYVNGMLVVNQNAMDKPGVRELVNYFYEFEPQRKCFEYGMSVRTDMMDRCIDFDDYSKTYGYRNSDGSRIVLTKEEDGPPCVEEYEALWSDAVYIEDSSEELFNIIIEEANAYFYSNKDIELVIDSMTRRVQLYLDERK